MDKVRALLNLLENDDVISHLLVPPEKEPQQPNIQIGEEINIREMSDCSVVSATYRLGGEVVGRVGVIGPKRMEYAVGGGNPQLCDPASLRRRGTQLRQRCRDGGIP